MKLGLIGTSYISHEFAQGAALAGFSIEGVLSRDKARGEEFMSRHGGGKVYTSIDEMAADNRLDTIYIASPNALHYPQSLAAVNSGKHIIVEKPCYMSSSQLKDVLFLAQQKSVYVLEALRSFYSPAMDKIRNALTLVAPIRHVYFNRMRYSSHYDDYKTGAINSSFSKELGGGAMADLGVYLVYAALDLFGMPKSLSYHNQYLTSGVDASSDVILRYEGFNCALATSKVSNSCIDSEIQGENGSILIKPHFLHAEIVFQDTKGNIKDIFNCKQIKDMHIQAEALFRIIYDRDSKRLLRAHQFMHNSTIILDLCRKEQGGYEEL